MLKSVGRTFFESSPFVFHSRKNVAQEQLMRKIITVSKVNYFFSNLFLSWTDADAGVAVFLLLFFDQHLQACFYYSLVTAMTKGADEIC